MNWSGFSKLRSVLSSFNSSLINSSKVVFLPAILVMSACGSSDEGPSNSSKLSSMGEHEVVDDYSGLEFETGVGGFIVCTESTGLRMRSVDDVDEVIKTVSRFADVLLEEDWETNQQRLSVDGVYYNFVTALIEGRRGLVVIDFIKTKEECPYYDEPEPDLDPSADLNNSEFPLEERTFWNYLTGLRNFGARRSDGRRKHAANDLKKPPGTDLYAIADGKITSSYYFYEGTCALELRLRSGVIVRYGETDCGYTSPVGSNVEKGDVIAKVGRLNSGNSMLHLEVYEGRASGKLTRSGNIYKRRWDLLDPTCFVCNWEFNKFSKSHCSNDDNWDEIIGVQCKTSWYRI